MARPRWKQKSRRQNVREPHIQTGKIPGTVVTVLSEYCFVRLSSGLEVYCHQDKRHSGLRPGGGGTTVGDKVMIFGIRWPKRSDLRPSATLWEHTPVQVE